MSEQAELVLEKDNVFPNVTRDEIYKLWNYLAKRGDISLDDVAACTFDVMVKSAPDAVSDIIAECAGEFIVYVCGPDHNSPGILVTENMLLYACTNVLYPILEKYPRWVVELVDVATDWLGFEVRIIEGREVLIDDEVYITKGKLAEWDRMYQGE